MVIKGRTHSKCCAGEVQLVEKDFISSTSLLIIGITNSNIRMYTQHTASIL